MVCFPKLISFMILNFNQKIIKLIPRNNGQNGFRIDRANWNYSKYFLNLEFYFSVLSHWLGFKLFSPIVLCLLQNILLLIGTIQ